VREESLLKLVLEGRMEGKRGRPRLDLEWLANWKRVRMQRWREEQRTENNGKDLGLPVGSAVWQRTNMRVHYVYKGAGVRCTRSTGVHEYMCTGKQVYSWAGRYTGEQVYTYTSEQVYMCTRCAGIQGLQVYRWTDVVIWRCTGETGVQGVHVYRYTGEQVYKMYRWAGIQVCRCAGLQI
jgi:hypothetical protein